MLVSNGLKLYAPECVISVIYDRIRTVKVACKCLYTRSDLTGYALWGCMYKGITDRVL